MMAPRMLATLWGLLFMVFSSTLHAGLFEDDEARRAILDLRQRVETMRMSIEVLRSENQSLIKKGSEVTDKNQDELQVLRRSMLDLQNQIESKVTLDGREFLVEPAEKREHDQAFDIFRKGEYGQAAIQWADFVRRYPQSGYKPTALFWLGNAQYAVKDYKEAMASFRSLVALAPHPRVPESLLALANCMIELKDTRGARKVLEDLIKAHPESEAAAAAKDRLSRLK